MMKPQSAKKQEGILLSCGAIFASFLALIGGSFITIVLVVNGNKTPGLELLMSWGRSVIFKAVNYLLLFLFCNFLPFTSHFLFLSMFRVLSTNFCLYICGFIYGAYEIMHHLGPDDAIIGAIRLFLGILNLFLNINANISRSHD